MTVTGQETKPYYCIIEVPVEVEVSAPDQDVAREVAKSWAEARRGAFEGHMLLPVNVVRVDELHE